MCPQVETATTRTVVSTNRVDSGSLSSLCCAFRRTHTSADPIRLLCIRLALPLTLFLPSGFVLSANTWFVFHLGPYGLWGTFRVIVCFGTRGEENLHRPVDPPVDTATVRTVLSTNRMNSGSFSTRGCAFRRTRTSADPIQLLCIRLALPLTLSLPSRFVPSVRLIVDGTPCALWCSGDYSCH